MFTWEIDLPLESRAKIFAKKSKISLCHLKNWTIPIIRHNAAVFWGGSGPTTSKMKLFVKVVNGFWPFTIFTKSFILEEACYPDPLLVLMKSFENFDCSQNQLVEFSVTIYNLNWMKLKFISATEIAIKMC